MISNEYYELLKKVAYEQRKANTITTFKVFIVDGHQITINVHNETLLDIHNEEGDWMNQEVKKDQGKPKLTLVPTQILYDICKVREFGVEKYKDPENWRNVEKERYRDAAFRHFLLYLKEPQGVDEESGISHLAHLACNIAFLCELEKE